MRAGAAVAAAAQSTSLRRVVIGSQARELRACTGVSNHSRDGGSTARSASLPSAMFDGGYVSAYAEMENLHQQQYQLHEKLRAITETMRLIDSVNPSTITPTMH